MQPKALIEDKRGRAIRLSKADIAKLRRVVGATGALRNEFSPYGDYSHCLNEDIRRYN